MDDPVLSGVTQTCVTKLEGEVTIHVSIVLIHHLVFMVSCFMTGISMKQL